MATDKFLYRVGAHIMERFGDDLQGLAIVFNNKRPQLFLKKYLAEMSGKPLWSPRFYTIQEFFSASTSLVCASRLKQFFVLLTEYNKLLQASGKETVSADIFYPLAEVIVSDFAQVDYYLADPVRLFGVIGNIAELEHQFPSFDEEQLEFIKSFWSSFSPERQNRLQEKFIEMWQLMPLLYQKFHSRLAEENLVTSAKMYRNLAEGHSSDSDFLKQFSHVVFVGFNALSKAEEQLFIAWQDAGLCSFYFDSDEHYFADPIQEAGHFIRRNINVTGLVNQFDPLESRINDPSKEFSIVQALGTGSQGKLLNSLLSEAGEGAPPHSRAIILADEALLLPVLQTVSGAGLNITMGYPFEQSAVYGLCDLWLKIQEEIVTGDGISIGYKSVLTFVFNPLVGVDAGKRNEIQWAIKKAKQSRFSLKELSELGTIARLSFVSYRNPTETIRNFGSMLLLISKEIEQLRKLESLLITEAVKALNILSDSFEELLHSDDLTSIEPKFVFRTIRRALTGLSVPFEGEPLSGLQVMGLLESRCLDFDELIILGMNEGVLPKVSISPSFIPDNVRRAFGLPVLENQNSIFAYFFYRLLHCAKKITLVYNGITDDKNTGEESRFIKQLRFETKCSFRDIIQQNQAVEIPRPQKIVVEKTGKVAENLAKYLRRNSNIQYEKKISATAFTDYVSCPLKFFYGRIAGLKEPEVLPDQIEPRLVGTMLHAVMESFYRDFTGHTISAELIRQQENKLPAMCETALIQTLNADPANPLYKRSALQKIVLKVIEQYAIRIIRHDEKLVPFTITELENRDSYTPLFAVQVNGKEEYVRLLGIIDRVDEHQGKVRIVDYKTGKDELKFKDFESLFSEDGKGQNKALIQLLFYTCVYELSRSVTHVEPHLYTVRKLPDETVFCQVTGRSQKLNLRDQVLEDFKEQFEIKLREELNELFDVTVPFVQTSNLETCRYCPYKIICQR